jgi:FKBP-type peptidyl-prolyl cis-trans isomerase
MPTNVTGTGIAVAVAVVVAVGLLFFGPEVFTFFNPAAGQSVQTATTTTTTTNPSTATQTMNDQSSNGASAQSSDSAATAAQMVQLNAVTQLEGKDLTVGTGATAEAGDSVTVNYVGMLTNGTVFDASASHGTTGFTFNLGAGQVIKGWDEGVVGMKVGGKRELVIPASLGYGAQAVGSIPANSVLVFEVELLNVTPPAGK